MQVLVLSGSKNHQGKTAEAISAIQKGVASGGGDSECIFLIDHNLDMCQLCNDDGWGICRSEHRCIINDDFAMIAEKVKAADVLVFATPVYFGDLSESIRGFLDRLRRTNFAFGGMPQGMPGGQSSTPRTPVIGVCYAGGSGNGTVSCAANLEKILQNCGYDVVDMIPVRRQNLEMKLPLLEATGEWLATKPTSGRMPPPPSGR